MSLDIEKIRRDTPCQNLYFNHASTSVPPLPVIEAVQEYYRLIMRYGATSAQAEKVIYARLNEALRALERLIGAEEGEVVFMPNGSQGIGMVAAGLPITKQSNVIVDELGFISNAGPFLRRKTLDGLEVRFAPAKLPGVLDLEALENMIDDNTVMIAVTHTANSLGVLQPLAEIGAISKRRGILFLVNASNTIGATDINVKTIGCDFLAASGRKYLRGPSGTGFLYASRKAAALIKPYFAAWNGGSWDWCPQDWDWSRSTYDPAPDARRFAYGEVNFPGIFGLRRAVEYLEELGGIEAVKKRISSLTEMLLEGLSHIPDIVVCGTRDAKDRSGILGLNIENVDYQTAAYWLNAHNVGVMGHHFFCPGVCRLFDIKGVLRLSVHYWNTEQEVVAVLKLLSNPTLRQK